MREAAAILVVAFMGSAGVLYCKRTLNEKIHPVFATWLMFAVAVTLSFATYMKSPEHSVVNNANNATDLIVTWSVCVAIWWRHGNAALTFTTLQIGCLVATGAITFFWGFTRNDVVANWLTQIILVVGYFPTLGKLWSEKRNSEPKDIWALTWAAAAVAFCIAFCASDALSMVYAARAFAMVSLLFVLMFRIWIRHG